GHFHATYAVTLVNPYLDADDPVRGVRLGKSVLDVGTQGVQGHTAFTVPLGTGNLDAIQATRAHDLDALRTQAHCVLHRALHGATEHDPALKLLRDRVSDQLGIELRLADFLDVDVHGHAQQALQIDLQAFDVLTLL